MNSLPSPVYGRRPQNSRAWDNQGRRSGFDPHRPGFRINDFNFHHYQTQWNSHCYPSPWYYYSFVPGFIDVQFTLFASNFVFAWEVGDPYHWEWHHHEFGVAQSLDESIDRIEDAFIHQSVSELTPLLPDNRDVQIDMENQPRYGLTGPDFQNMLGDLIYAVNTNSYTVVDVWRNGRYATVVADHEYTDSDGAIVHQRHWFGLKTNGALYRIISFRSEPN